MKKHTNKGKSTTHTKPANKHESTQALLDSLIRLTTEEINTGVGQAKAHIENKHAFALIIESFLQSQPGIQSYVRDMDGPLWDCVYLIALALRARYGWVPVLTPKTLRAAEAQAEELLAAPSSRVRVECLPVVSFMQMLCCGASKPTPMPDPHRERLMLKMLTIWLGFAKAYADSQPKKTGAAVPALTPAQFTQELVAKLERSAPNLHCRILRDLELEFTGSDRNPGPCHLQTAYREYMLNQCPENDLIAHHALSILEGKNIDYNAPIDRSSIVPLLKTTSWLKRTSKKPTSAADDPEQYAHKPFIKDLIIMYAVDGPGTIRYLSNKDVVGLNLSVDELHRIAVTNLVRLLPPLSIQEDNGIYTVTCDSNYEASLVLIDEVWDKAHFAVRGEIVVAVPARDRLFVTGSDSAEHIRRLSLLAQEQAAESRYAVSSKLLIRREGKVVPNSAPSRPGSAKGSPQETAVSSSLQWSILLHEQTATGAMISDIHIAVQEGDLKKVKSWLKHTPALVFSRDGLDRTLLQFAAIKGHKEVAELLLAKGAEINSKGTKGETPLHLAASLGHVHVVKLLLGKGADVNAKAKDRVTPLHLAALEGTREVAALLLAKGAAINAEDQDSNTPLHWATIEGHTDMARLLVINGAEVNAQNTGHQTPLYAAADAGHKEIAKLLLANGAEVNATTTDGDTTLHKAAGAGHKEIAELLLANGAEVDTKNRTAQTPLHFSAFHGHKDVVELLLTKGAQVNCNDKSGQTPLHSAAALDHKDIVAILLANGANVNAKGGDGETPLHFAAQQGHRDMAALLLAKGADVNSRTQNGKTARDLAEEKGHKDLAQLLMPSPTPKTQP
jgi:ankyrin repeat protein/uncharacterized protein YtpQ (UPF0354 family)